MTRYFITYDIESPQPSPGDIYAFLANQGAQHVLQSSWILETDWSLEELESNLTGEKGPIKSKDHLVLRSSINSAIHTVMGVLHGQKVCES